MKNYLYLFLPLITAIGASADVSVTHEFSNNMVLQRELPVSVYGTADPGESVTVEFAGQKVSGKPARTASGL